MGVASSLRRPAANGIFRDIDDDEEGKAPLKEGAFFEHRAQQAAYSGKSPAWIQEQLRVPNFQPPKALSSGGEPAAVANATGSIFKCGGADVEVVGPVVGSVSCPAAIAPHWKKAGKRNVR